jgi:VHS domain
MDVVSTINAAVDPTYAANKACKRICLRLRTRNQRVQYVALQLLENCMRSCGESFHNELANSDLFTNELARMADRSIWCATEIQRLVLALIQEWAYEIKIPGYSALFNRLKQRGLPFGPRGVPTDQVFQPYPGLSPPSPGAALAAGADGGAVGDTGSPRQPGSARHRRHSRAEPPHQQQGNGGGHGGRGGANLGPHLLNPGRSTSELRADLDTARGTVTLLNEVLDGAEKEGNYAAVKEEYCVEVAGACDAIKERVAGLLGSGISDEGVVAAAIEVNDDAQRALDRRMVLIEVADGRRAAPVVAVALGGDGGALGAGSGAAGVAAAAAAPTPTVAAPEAPVATTAPAPANLMDLLDLDWTPAPEPGSNVADPFLPPAPMMPPPMNNPFAAPGCGGGSDSGADAFGSVAPIAFEGKQQQASSSAVVASAPQQASPSGEKSKPKSNPFLNDDAFSQLSLSRETSGVGPVAVPPAPASPISKPTNTSTTAPAQLSSRPSGNPFASMTAAEPAAFNRPPSLVIPGHDPIAAGFTPGPFTAPAGGGGAFFGGGGAGAAGNVNGTAGGGAGMVAPSPAYQAFHAPLPTAGAVPYHHQQQQHYSGQQFSATGAGVGGFGAPSPFVPTPQQQHGFATATPTPGMYGTNQMPGQPPVSDSFKDLVVLKSKKEEAPPPPKGSPMRRGGGGSTPKVGGAGEGNGNGNGNGDSFSPRPEVTAAPVATTEAAPAPAAASGLSAFDAFDALASGR